MKWYKLIRGLIFGVGLVVIPFTMGGFHSTRGALASVAFIAVGLSLIALIAWATIKEFKRTRLKSEPRA